MALVSIRRSPSLQSLMKTDDEEKTIENDEDDPDSNRISKSLNECYFANKGAALVLGEACPGRPRSPARAPPPDIQHHLQAMFCLLRPEETLKMAVKLESAHMGRTRYLVVVCRGDEAALLGIDCNEHTTVGLVLRVLADTAIKLDGDGGFSVCVCSQQHIFKPVSVQAMWSALQTLHRASGRARGCNHFAGGPTHTWVQYYEERVGSDRSCLNEWHAMDSIESRRPPSPDSLRHKPRERDETERVIRCTLKEIMMSVDLDEVTSKVIRGRLEEELDMDLAEYKSFIDQEMLTILGQMDAPTEIFDHVYLGSEWNASNLEELQRNGIRHILNVTREIDNFFPGMFDYLNIRVYDDDKTDLLKHWDNTFKYINKARREGSKVLVHCKMGISRSASVVIAYAMKAYNWNFDKALEHVKTKRTCIKPNTNFLSQLETYQGILDAMKNKEKLQRSKSETNLKYPKSGVKRSSAGCGGGGGGGESGGRVWRGGRGARPRSWSPASALAAALLPPTSVSLEHLAAPPAPPAPEARHMLMPCANGTYSVSPNQIIRLKEDGAVSVRHIVHEIETRKLPRPLFADAPSDNAKNSPSRQHRLTQSADAEKIHTWDPGEPSEDAPVAIELDNIVKCDSGIVDVKGEESMAGEGDEPGPPSRQSSWSSSDSGAGRGPPRSAVDLAIIQETKESRARTRDISDNERKFNATCAILNELATKARTAGARRGGASTWGGRLSAPDTWLRAGRRRLAAASHGDLRAPPAPPGLVSNLKKEFEARSASEAEGGGRATAAAGERAADDLSVRVLVDRYDRSAERRPRLGWENEPRARAAPFLRNSFCGAVRGNAERPPPAPNVLSLAPINYPSVLMSTVMSKAQNKKQLQHGKTHPLTRLNMNRSNNRCSNPVYNTM